MKAIYYYYYDDDDSFLDAQILFFPSGKAVMKRLCIPSEKKYIYKSLKKTATRERKLLFFSIDENSYTFCKREKVDVVEFSKTTAKKKKKRERISWIKLVLLILC